MTYSRNYTQVDVTPLSDLDASPTCEVEFITWSCTITCSNPAAWWGISLCCGDRGLYCGPCKKRADGVGPHRLLLDVCAVCGGRGIRWVKL